LIVYADGHIKGIIKDLIIRMQSTWYPYPVDVKEHDACALTAVFNELLLMTADETYRELRERGQSITPPAREVEGYQL